MKFLGRSLRPGQACRMRRIAGCCLPRFRGARRELILTTPYFVPDEPTLLSLMMAADRGVAVKLILPQMADHFFAAAAGRAHYLSLLQSGVTIHLYGPGLIHAKTATVDDAFAIFGSANLDVRSFSLNFELSVMLYGQRVTNRLRTIQKEFLANSRPLQLADWHADPSPTAMPTARCRCCRRCFDQKFNRGGKIRMFFTARRSSCFWPRPLRPSRAPI